MLPAGISASPSRAHAPAWQHQRPPQRRVLKTLPPCQLHLALIPWRAPARPQNQSKVALPVHHSKSPIWATDFAAPSTLRHQMASLGTHRLHLNQLEAALVLLGTDCSESLHLLPWHCLGQFRQQPAGTKVEAAECCKYLVHALPQSHQPEWAAAAEHCYAAEHDQLRDACVQAYARHLSQGMLPSLEQPYSTAQPHTCMGRSPHISGWPLAAVLNSDT